MNALSKGEHTTGSTRLRLLMIGPLPPPIGGTRVSFKMLVDALSRRADVALRVIGLPPVRSNKIRGVGHFISQSARMLIDVPRSDVVALHCGISSIQARGAVTHMIARLFGKPLLFRTFGGEALRKDSGPGRSEGVLRVLKKADMYLAQTKEHIRQAREGGVARVEWFPTCRPMSPMPDRGPQIKRRCRRFVFVSHVKQTKGIGELIAAGERFGEDITIDVYGPFREGMAENVFDGCRRARYCGVISPDKVVELLSEYDALLLPTYHAGEGYPGIIMEAYAAGIPVICSRWRCLPEIVDENSGILVEPRNADALCDAMKTLIESPDLYARLRRGVLEKRPTFDAEMQTERFVGFCREAVSRRHSA